MATETYGGDSMEVPVAFFAGRSLPYVCLKPLYLVWSAHLAEWHGLWRDVGPWRKRVDEIKRLFMSAPRAVPLADFAFDPSPRVVAAIDFDLARSLAIPAHDLEPAGP